jgi:hypothetical protein
MFAKLPFTYLKLPPIQIHFTKTTLGFSVITKVTLFICTFKFSKVSHNTHELHTNKHILHTNKIFA